MNSTHGWRRENRLGWGRRNTSTETLLWHEDWKVAKDHHTRLIDVPESVLKGVTAKHPRQNVSKTCQNLARPQQSG